MIIILITELCTSIDVLLTNIILKYYVNVYWLVTYFEKNFKEVIKWWGLLLTIAHIIVELMVEGRVTHE